MFCTTLLSGISVYEQCHSPVEQKTKDTLCKVVLIFEAFASIAAITIASIFYYHPEFTRLTPLEIDFIGKFGVLSFALTMTGSGLLLLKNNNEY